MSLPYAPVTYTGDGTTATFAVPWPYLNKTDVTVTVAGVATTNFTWPSGSTVNLYVAPPSGAAVVIQRSTSISTLISSFTAGDLTALSLNRAFNQLLYVVQEVLATVMSPTALLMAFGFSIIGSWSNSVAYSVGNTVSYNGSSYYALVANTNVEPDTNPSTWFPLVVAPSISTLNATVNSVAALRGAATTNNAPMRTLGYYAPGDGGHNSFVCVTGQATGHFVDNGGTIIVPTGGNGSAAWVALPGPVNVLQFGAKGDAGLPTNGITATNVTATGTNVITIAAGGNQTPPSVGMRVAAINWHSVSSAFPVATVIGVSGTSITLSSVVPAGSYQISGWAPINSTTVGGTDSTQAFLNAIYWGIQNPRTVDEIFVPAGIYRIGDMLPLGFGNSTYTSLKLIGEWRGGYSPGVGGTHIISTMTDRPAVNIQGGRKSGIQGIAFWGPNLNYPAYAQAWNSYLSSDPLDWMSPDLVASGTTPGGAQQNTPLVGASIDAFSGSTPTAPYPLTIPSWAGFSSAYGAGFSSDTLFEDCSFGGYVVQVAIGLNTSNQGDFLKMPRCSVQYGCYGISVGNTQSRNVGLTDITFGVLNTFIDGTSLGMGNGVFAGPITNIAGSNSYQIANFQGMGYCGPLKFSNCYVESTVRIGNFIGNTAFSYAVEFDSCTFILGDCSGYLTIPGSLISAGSNQTITIRNSAIETSTRMTVLCSGAAAQLIVESCSFQGPQGAGGNANLAQAYNYWGGFYVGVQSFWPKQSLVSYYPDATNLGSRLVGDLLTFASSAGSSNVVPETGQMLYFNDAAGRRWDIQRYAAVNAPLGSGEGWVSSPPTWVNDVMTFSLSTANYASQLGMVIQPGWILYHPATSTVFVVNSVTLSGSNYVISCIQQNNLKVTSTHTYLSNLLVAPTLNGGVWVVPTGRQCSGTVFFANFTSGSTSVTGVTSSGGATGYGGNVTSYLANGQTLWPSSLSDPTVTPWPISTTNAITTLSAVANGSGGTFTMSVPATATMRAPVWAFPIH